MPFMDDKRAMKFSKKVNLLQEMLGQKGRNECCSQNALFHSPPRQH